LNGNQEFQTGAGKKGGKIQFKKVHHCREGKKGKEERKPFDLQLRESIFWSER